jgi:hypothetical protein
MGILQYVRANGSDPVEKENLMMYRREAKARDESVNMRKGV